MIGRIYLDRGSPGSPQIAVPVGLIAQNTGSLQPGRIESPFSWAPASGSSSRADMGGPTGRRVAIRSSPLTQKPQPRAVSVARGRAWVDADREAIEGQLQAKDGPTTTPTHRIMVTGKIEGIGVVQGGNVCAVMTGSKADISVARHAALAAGLQTLPGPRKAAATAIARLKRPARLCRPIRSRADGEVADLTSEPPGWRPTVAVQ